MPVCFSIGKKEGVLEVVLFRRNELLGRRVYLARAKGQKENMQINYKMNFIKDSFQRFPEHFKSTSQLLFVKVSILNHKEMYFPAYIRKICLKELDILLRYTEIFATL